MNRHKIKYLLVIALTAASLISFASAQTIAAQVPLGELLPLTHKTKAAQNAESSPFKIRALHVPLQKKRSPISDLRPLIKQAGLRGYNAVVLLIGSQGWSTIQMHQLGKVVLDGYTAEQMRELVQYCRSVGMEPIFGFKIIGKQKPMLKDLAKKYPDLLVTTTPGFGTGAGVINSAFRFPGGRTPFQAVVKPIINEIISWYGNQPPKYIWLAQDEIAVNDIAAVGKKSGRSAAQVFADAMNRCSAYLLTKNITPVFSSDMLLSRRLAKPGNGVKGFTFDPRFARNDDGTYNAERGARGSGASVLTAVNYLKYKDKIVIANWHYAPHIHGQYPSVDYFHAVGIKHIWGVTFYQKKAIRQYTRYAASHGVQGMVAGTFFMSWKLLPWARAKLPPLVNNSILYYLNPDFKRPTPSFISYKVKAKSGPTLARGPWGFVLPASANALIVEAQVPKSIDPQHVQIWLVDENGRERLVSKPLSAARGQVRSQINLKQRRATIPSLFELWMRYRDANTGYLAQKVYKGRVGLAGKRPAVAGTNTGHAFFAADFSSLPKAASHARLLLAPGEFGSLILLRGPAKKTWHPFSDHALNSLAVGAAFAWPRAGMWQAIAQKGMRVVLDVKLTRPVGKKPKPWATIAGFGDYQRGFRLMVHSDGKVLFTVSQDRPTSPPRPGWLEYHAPIQVGQWAHIQAWLTPPDQRGHRTMGMQINGGKVQKIRLTYDVRAPQKPVGIGVEFIRKSTKPSRKRRPNFPGLIRSMKILPY